MRELNVSALADALAGLCEEANVALPCDVEAAVRRSRQAEPWPDAQGILDTLLENIAAAREDSLPLCQDTGAACVFLELGQDIRLTGGSLREAIDEGVRRGYAGLRKSIVRDPLRRVNTGDNTPAFLHVDIVEGDRVRLTLAPKGFGSENMSALRMLKPSDGVEGFVSFVVDAVRGAGPNPCPPVVVGVGVGGTFDSVALLAKRALLRPLDCPNPDPFYAALEERILGEINALGIGPQGFGGATTALGVRIEAAPTHIAGLPAAVNMSCHVTRRQSVDL